MAQLVSDTLKQRGNGDFPIVNAKDVALENGMSVEDSIYEEVRVGEEPPTDERTKLWVDDSSNFAEDKLDVLAEYNEYSDEEVCIGQYIDGRPLYRKVISRSGVSYSGTGDVVIDNIPNYELVDYCGHWTNSIGNRFAILYSDALGYAVYLQCVSDGSVKMSYKIHTSWPMVEYTIVIKYTKTTDEADSFHPSMIKTFPSAKRMVVADFEDYSTDEIVIGRWIDGRPIYKRTVEGTSVANDILFELDSNVRCISFKGFIDRDDYQILEYNTYHSSALSVCVYQHCNYSGKNVVMMYIIGNNYTNKPCVTTIEYIKTTDSPNSFDPNMLSTATMKYEATEDEVAYVLGGE